jgi:hypothetical protein
MMEKQIEERELVPVRVKPREKEQEKLKPIEELPTDWKQYEIPHCWRVQ